MCRPTGERCYVGARAQLARQLGMLCDVPWPEGTIVPTTAPNTPMPLHIGDPVGRFWARLRDARLALMAGSVSAAEQILEVPPTWFPMPEHLRVVLVGPRTWVTGHLAGNAQALRAWADELVSLGARGEAQLLTGLRHELESDRKAALQAYAVAQEDVTYSQPASRALALTCEAQLLDVIGPFRRRDRPPPGRGHAHRDPPQRSSVPGLEPSGHPHGDLAGHGSSRRRRRPGSTRSPVRRRDGPTSPRCSRR